MYVVLLTCNLGFTTTDLVKWESNQGKTLVKDICWIQIILLITESLQFDQIKWSQASPSKKKLLNCSYLCDINSISEKFVFYLFRELKWKCWLHTTVKLFIDFSEPNQSVPLALYSRQREENQIFKNFMDVKWNKHYNFVIWLCIGTEVPILPALQIRRI